MIETYLIGIAGIVALMVAWAAIQQVWRKAFAEHVTDEDALAERTRCTNCGCTTVCEKGRRNVSERIHQTDLIDHNIKEKN